MPQPVREGQEGDVVSSWALVALLETRAPFLQATLVSDLDGQPADQKNLDPKKPMTHMQSGRGIFSRRCCDLMTMAVGTGKTPLPSALGTCEAS